MQEPYYWYVLFVRAGTEHRVAEDIKQYFELHPIPYEFDAFCPESEHYYRSKDRTAGRCYKRRPLFPGYVFLETQMPSTEFLATSSTYIFASSDIIRVLRYGDSDRIALPENERMRLEFLLKGKRCVEHSVGYILGDKIHIECGPLVGFEGNIVHLDRHNRSATIELDMFGGKNRAVLALEIVSKA